MEELNNIIEKTRIFFKTNNIDKVIMEVKEKEEYEVGRYIYEHAIGSKNIYAFTMDMYSDLSINITNIPIAFVAMYSDYLFLNIMGYLQKKEKKKFIVDIQEENYIYRDFPKLRKYYTNVLSGLNKEQIHNIYIQIKEKTKCMK